MKHDVENIERATLAAVSPEAVLELSGWLLAFDTGTVGRAKSAVPMLHTPDMADAGMVRRIEQHYAARGMQASFRLPDVPGFDAMRQALVSAGYGPQQPTLVQTGLVSAMCSITNLPLADVDDAPDAGWAAVFLGAGFDSVDGASRVKRLSQAPGSVFASVREAGQSIAAGAGAFSHGWASVHGMRTAAAHRGQGLAGRVLAGLAAAAQQRGLNDVFLQVEEGNTAARALYMRAGFSTVWKYVYWRKPSIKSHTGDAC
jgi:N-acetylglutamate synthase